MDIAPLQCMYRPMLFPQLKRAHTLKQSLARFPHVQQCIHAVLCAPCAVDMDVGAMGKFLKACASIDLRNSGTAVPADKAQILGEVGPRKET